MSATSFPPDHTFDLQATERFAAIREMLQCLVRVGAIPSHAEEPLFAAMQSREEVMSTAIGYGIACPHAASDMVTQRVTALGRLKSGVEFSSLDGKPVRAIAMLIIPRSEIPPETPN